MLDRETTAIPFSTEAMKANLLRLQNEWESVQASGSNLTFESEAGFPPDWSHASLAHANRYLHHSQAR